MKKKRQVLAQGDRDGACFLYAIANAAGALRGKVITHTQWLKCIRSLPFDMGDFMAGRGTEKIDWKPHYLEGLCRDFLAALDVRSEVSWRDELTSPKQLRNLLITNQVFVMGVYDDNHWVTVVDAVGETIYAACSSEALDGEREYLETSSPRLARVYNKQGTLAELRAEKAYGLLISVSHDA
ncbi:MAG: hypothetical protein B7Z35_01165 [Hydrogenophilales bacterium 12-61-10]|nr:MAG: hypothetical protein B7Z35_01165 [Hydrogenophilales bacterium 12-61-10]OYX31236.1 MAG: hypothetical protein B7Z03_04540 [Hydrogenophilales bacterium 32-62-9]